MSENQFVKGVNDSIQTMVDAAKTHSKHSYDASFYDFSVVEIANKDKIYKISPEDGSVLSELS